MFTRWYVAARSWLRREEGQAMVEYSIIVGLISIAAIAMIALIGPEILTIFTKVKDALVSFAPAG